MDEATYEGKGTMNPSNVFNVTITRAVPTEPTTTEQPFQGLALRGGCDSPHFDSLNGKLNSIDSGAGLSNLSVGLIFAAQFQQYLPDQECCEIWYEDRQPRGG